MLCVGCIFGSNAQTIYGKTVEEIRVDPDWQFITKTSQLITQKMIENNITLSETDLSVDNFIAKLKMTKEEFETLNTKFKEAAQRLNLNYGLSKAMPTCESCKLTIAQKLAEVNKTIIKFKSDPRLMKNYFASMQGTTSTSCCGFWFYACCGVCAATIEAFPVYLACCGLCYHSECCSSASANAN